MGQVWTFFNHFAPIRIQFVDFSVYADSIWALRKKVWLVLTIEGVDSPRNPLHYGISHFSSPHTLDTQVLKTEKNKETICVV